MRQGGEAHIVEHVPAVPFGATPERSKTSVARAGLILFGRLDHRVRARKAGLEMPSATALTYGYARGGTPVVPEAPLTALDLRSRVLIRLQEDGRTMIGFRPVGLALQQAGVRGHSGHRRGLCEMKHSHIPGS